MFKNLTTSLVVAVLACAPAMAGTISVGSIAHTVKTPSIDLNHTGSGPRGGVICEIIAPSDEFVDLLGDADNSSYDVDLAGLIGAIGPVVITDIGWDVSIESVGASWLSEASFALSTDTDPTPLPQPLTLTPGAGDDFAGSATYSSGGPINLIGAIGENLVSVDGLVNIELFESFDDTADATDALLLAGSSLTFVVTDALTFTSSTVEVKWVPEPASFGMLSLAGLVMLLGRRKK